MHCEVLPESAPGKPEGRQGTGKPPRAPAASQECHLTLTAVARVRTEEGKDFKKTPQKETRISRLQLVSEGDREQAAW